MTQNLEETVQRSALKDGLMAAFVPGGILAALNRDRKQYGNGVLVHLPEALAADLTKTIVWGIGIYVATQYYFS